MNVKGTLDATGRTLLQATFSWSARSREEDPWQPGNPGVFNRVTYTVRNVPLGNHVDAGTLQGELWYFGRDDAAPHLSEVVISWRDAWHVDQSYDFSGWEGGKPSHLMLNFTRRLAKP